MNIIFLSGRKGGGGSRYLNLAHPACLAVIAFIVLGTLGTAFAIGIQLGVRTGGLNGRDSDRFHHVLAEQQAEIAQLKARVQERADAFAARLGAIDAHIIRIDALGRRLTSLANVDRKEFNFDDGPGAGAGAAARGVASGGPAIGQNMVLSANQSGDPSADQNSADQNSGGGRVTGNIADIATALSDLEQRVDLRDAQLAALENAMNERKIAEAVRPAGAPVAEATISSHFGERTDPVTGEEGHFHKGLDFAGARGEPVQAVAAGIVTQAGEHTGYGNLVEINHGNGYVTRYGHNEKIIVKVGQSVVRGQEIALLGSTGHSTGPHVHFEVLRNGRQVDPLSFVKSDPKPSALRQVASRG